MQHATATTATNHYLYNGKEINKELGLDWYDYGARWQDPTTGRFTTIDRFSEKYFSNSSFGYAANNPISNMDVNGDSVWVTSNRYVDDMGRNVTNYKIHVTGKILDLSSANEDGIATGINEFYNQQRGRWADSNGDLFNISFAVNFEGATSMSDVSETDHLLVVVDDVLGKSDPHLGGGDAGGLASKPGQIGYIEYSSSLENMISTGIHEFGHNMGLSHVANGTNNVMSYDDKRTNFTIGQKQDMLFNSMSGDPNNGHNRQISPITTNNWFYNTSTNQQPWYKNTVEGQVIPKILINRRK